MTKLSVNINKVALIRNARGSNLPDVVRFARDCETYGAHGITIHPRPDQRHIRYEDISLLKDVVTTELNIEGYPSEEFLTLIHKNKPHQCTLVPDPPNVLTSDAGWDILKNKGFLKEVINQLHVWNVRVSLFVDPIPAICEEAKSIGADRVEFYTGPYAHLYTDDRELAIRPYLEAAEVCKQIQLEMNAGHDLNLENLNYLLVNIPEIAEVSIGHALICDALYFGIKNTIQMYLSKIHRA